MGGAGGEQGSHHDIGQRAYRLVEFLGEALGGQPGEGGDQPGAHLAEDVQQPGGWQGEDLLLLVHRAQVGHGGGQGWPAGSHYSYQGYLQSRLFKYNQNHKL